MEIPQEEPKTAVDPAKPLPKTESAVSTAIAKFNVDQSFAVALRDFFEPLERQANEWKEKAFQLVITDGSQTEEIKQAKEARLAVRQIRLNIEKLHKEKKESALRTGQTLDLIKRTLVDLVEPIETHLKKQEDFVELQEKNRVAELYKSRLAELEPYRVPGDNIDVLDLGAMSDIVFNGIKAGVINAHQQREQEKADELRIAKEKEEKDRKERERLKEENEKLKAYTARAQSLTTLGFVWNETEQAYIHPGIDDDGKNIQHSIEKKAIETFADVDFIEWFDFVSVKITKHNQEQERIRKQQAAAAKELQDKKDAEELATKQKALDEKKAARAPDKTKLLALAESIKNISQPEMKTDDGKNILLNVQTLLAKVNKYITDQCANL